MLTTTKENNVPFVPEEIDIITRIRLLFKKKHYEHTTVYKTDDIETVNTTVYKILNGKRIILAKHGWTTVNFETICLGEL